MSDKKPLAVVILAAGKSTRMKSSVPKVLQPLAGKPMIKWLLESVEALKPKKVIVVTGPDMPDLEAAAAPHKTAIQPERNGTGGAVMAAMPALKGFKGDVLILLGDTPLIRTETLRALIKSRKGVLSILGCEMEDPTGYGRVISHQDAKGHEVFEIVEEKDASAAQKKVNLVNTGAFCVDAEKLPGLLDQLDDDNAQGELYITQLPALISARGEKCSVSVIRDPREVQGCNTPVELAALEQCAQNRLRNQHMKSGVIMLDPATVYLHHDTEIAPGVTIEPSVFFGPGVRVQEGARIKAFSHIEGADIGKGASIGPFARIRSETQIGADVRIGNFVEIKKAKLGKGSKVNHLAYVGDCTMGADVNFSAGAITVNYDGFNKHHTTIGDGAMVGSNVNLVAPVTIKEGAFIAAGSTITEDVPAEALAIERHSTEIRKGWASQNRKDKKKAS